MRALLLTNPKATTVSPRAQQVIDRAIANELELETAETRYRGHATTLARQAVVVGYDLIIALGGDGTVNEAANGLLSSSPDPSTPESLPALAVVPGGNANVFARALGLPRDPVEATGVLLEALRTGSTRTIGLGRADDRYFTFCAGLGLDAEVIRAVEGLRAYGHQCTPPLYVRTALHQYFTVTDRRRPALRLSRPDGHSLDHLFMGLVSNATPWTYLGPYAVSPNPRASFDTGLDVFALRRLRTLSTLNQIRQFLTPDGKDSQGRHTITMNDVRVFTFSASRPIAFQLDGEYLGERDEVTFHAVPRALRVIAGSTS